MLGSYYGKGLGMEQVEFFDSWYEEWGELQPGTTEPWACTLPPSRTSLERTAEFGQEEWTVEPEPEPKPSCLGKRLRSNSEVAGCGIEKAPSESTQSKIKEGKNDSSPSFLWPRRGEGGRGARGLKVLGSKVQDIVRKHTQPSYKEVAELLIAENYASRHGGGTATGIIR